MKHAAIFIAIFSIGLLISSICFAGSDAAPDSTETSTYTLSVRIRAVIPDPKEKAQLGLLLDNQIVTKFDVRGQSEDDSAYDYLFDVQTDHLPQNVGIKLVASATKGQANKAVYIEELSINGSKFVPEAGVSSSGSTDVETQGKSQVLGGQSLTWGPLNWKPVSASASSAANVSASSSGKTEPALPNAQYESGSSTNYSTGGLVSSGSGSAGGGSGGGGSGGNGGGGFSGGSVGASVNSVRGSQSQAAPSQPTPSLAASAPPTVPTTTTIPKTTVSMLPALRGIMFAASAAQKGNYTGAYNYSDPNFWVFGKTYTYNAENDYAYFASKGFNIVRIPVLWERVQRSLGNAYDADELARIDSAITYAEKYNMYVMLDVHNYGRYFDQLMNTPELLDGYQKLWGMLARKYRDHPRVMFDLMNEPHGMLASEYQKIMQTGIDGVRATGATNIILVEGAGWSEVPAWLSSQNATILTIKDPENNILYEPHYYLNQTHTGSGADCLPSDSLLSDLNQITTWAKTNKVKLLLGETGAGYNDVCKVSFASVLKYLKDNNTVWQGWVWYDADPWNLVPRFELEPKRDITGIVTSEAPQLPWLLQ